MDYQRPLQSTLLCLSILVLLGTACNSNTSNSGTTARGEPITSAKSLTEDTTLAVWAELIRGTEIEVAKVYTENPVFLGPTGSLGFPLEEQIRYHQIRYKDLTSLVNLHRTIASEEPRMGAT